MESKSETFSMFQQTINWDVRCVKTSPCNPDVCPLRSCCAFQGSIVQKAHMIPIFPPF